MADLVRKGTAEADNLTLALSNDDLVSLLRGKVD